MKLVHKYPMLGSSVDPDKIGLTVKSIGLAIVPVVIAIARYNGLEIVEADLVQFVNAVATIASCVGVIYGVYRKIFFKK